MPLPAVLQAYFVTAPAGAENALHEDSLVEPLLDGESFYRELGLALAALGKKSIAENQAAGEFIYIANLMLTWDDIKVPNALGVLEPLETVILDKAAKGVEVRVLGWAHYALNPPTWDLRPRAIRNWFGVAFDRVGPARWNAQTARQIVRLRAGAVGAGAALNVLSHPGGCAHTKLIIVGNDSTSMTAFTGGMDLVSGRYALMTHEGDTNSWHDVVVKVQGLAAKPCYGLFKDLWRQNLANPPIKFLIDGTEILHMMPAATPTLARVPRPAAAGAVQHYAQSLRTLPARTATATLVTDPPPYFWPDAGVFEIREAILRAISQAKNYIYIEDQYFWSEELFNALKTALQDPARPNLRVVLLTGSMQDPLDEANVKVYRDYLMWTSLVSGLTGPQLARLKFYFRWGEIGYALERRHVIASVDALPLDPSTDRVVSNVPALDSGVDEDAFKGWGLAFTDGVQTFKVKGNPPIPEGSPLVFHVSGGANPRMSAFQPYELQAATKIFVHAKTVIVDDSWALIGSANFARRSMRTDLEHAVAFTSTDAGIVKDYRKSLWAHHVRISPATIDNLNTALEIFFPPAPRRWRPGLDFPDYIETAVFTAKTAPANLAAFQNKFDADSTIPEWSPL